VEALDVEVAQVEVVVAEEAEDLVCFLEPF